MEQFKLKFYLQEGIAKLQITDDGIRLEGVAEFREAVHARDISAIEVRQ